MNNQKLNNFIDEMMVTFHGNDGSIQPASDNIVSTDGEANDIVSEPPVMDLFTNAANDMLKQYNTTFDTIAPANHVTVVDDMNDSPADDGAEVHQIDMASGFGDETGPQPDMDQIMFDVEDGNLHIKIADTDIYLAKDAVDTLRDYLNSDEFKSDIESSQTDESDSEMSEDDTEYDDDDSDDGDDSEDDEAEDEDDSSESNEDDEEKSEDDDSEK